MSSVIFRTLGATPSRLDVILRLGSSGNWLGSRWIYLLLARSATLDAADSPAEGDAATTPAEGDAAATPAEGDAAATPADGDAAAPAA